MNIKPFFERTTLIILLSINTIGYAQITTDGTLGPSQTLSGPNYQIGPDLGQQHGENLFHSFQAFNLQSFESATFSGPNGIQNVISRVTGDNPSNIDGTLRSTIPGANFYFLNPSGILFGPNAKLDVQGSFYASTADYLTLGDNGRFSATHPENSLLTVAPIRAFGFLDAPTPITVTGSQFSVPTDHKLSLIGGDLEIKNSQLFAIDGSIHLLSIASQGELTLTAQPNEFLSHFAKLGQINLLDSQIGNATDIAENGARNLYIIGEQFVADNSALDAKQIQERTGNADGIVINMRDAITLKNEHTNLVTDTYTANPASNISMRANRVNMSQAAISNNTQRNGAKAGTIHIQANEITMTDNSNINSNTSQNGGAGGNIILTIGKLQMSDDAQINATTKGTNKQAGKIQINANEIHLSGKAIINLGTYTSFFQESTGNGGEAIIHAQTLIMTDSASIMSSSFNTGQSGDIRIFVNQLDLSGQSAIASTTFSEGPGGPIEIQVKGTLSLSESAVINSGTEGAGPGGSLILEADQIILTNTAAISSASEFSEDAFVTQIATLIEKAKELDAISDNTLFAGGGQAGSILIKTNQLSISNGAAIAGFSGGTGWAGDVMLMLSGDLHLDKSQISTEAAEADGGNITLQTNGKLNLYQSAITATVNDKTGNGGNITIGNPNTPKFVILNDSQIIAKAVEGRGGNIYIVTDNFIPSNQSEVSASSQRGIDGTVNIEAPDNQLIDNVLLLPKAFSDASLLLRQCQEQNTPEKKSTLIIKSPSGLPKMPDELF